MQLRDDQIKAAILKKALLPQEQVDFLQKWAQDRQKGFLEALFEKEAIPDAILGTVIAELYGVPFVQLRDMTIKETTLNVVPFTLASHQFVIPFKQEADQLHVAMLDPQSDELVNFLEKKTGMKIVPYFATQKDLQLGLKAYSRDVNQKFNKLLEGAMEDPHKLESLKDASKIVDTIILFAFQSEASDIHIEPQKSTLIVRYRIDGILKTIAELPASVTDLVITRIKVLADLRTDEHRAAQDGRFKITLENNEITLRVSILPIYEGEKVVMRLLTSSRQTLDLSTFGYTKENLAKINNAISKTNGIILVTGPTGSGKTTTLYAILKLLNSPEVNISTIEDPIEYRLEGVNQTQVNRKTDLTFANGLRALVRQDPDIVLVGEIRDAETASVAINASLTGHLVLATLHTNDAASTLPRMLEMGVEGFLLAATAKLVVAQRLVRKVCEHCRKPYTLSKIQIEELAKRLNLTENLFGMIESIRTDPTGDVTFYRGEGCEVCGHTGFKGRTSISEVMEVSPEVRDMIAKNSAPSALQDLAVTQGMKTMFMDGLWKGLDGITTLEEVLRVMKS